jgi:hypothetical protein
MTMSTDEERRWRDQREVKKERYLREAEAVYAELQNELSVGAFTALVRLIREAYP